MKRVYGSHQIEETLRPYIRKKDWALLSCHIHFFDIYQALCGSEKAEKVVQMLDMLVSDVIKEMGTSEDVFGSDDNFDLFIIITSEVAALKIKEALKSKFNSEVLTHYSTLDRERGYMMSSNNEKIGLMHISVGIFSPGGDQMSDIRDILNK